MSEYLDTEATSPTTGLVVCAQTNRANHIPRAPLCVREIYLMDWDETSVIGSGVVMDKRLAPFLKSCISGKSIIDSVQSLGTRNSFNYSEGGFNFHKVFRAINDGVIDLSLLSECFANFANSSDEIISLFNFSPEAIQSISGEFSHMQELLDVDISKEVALNLLECFWHISSYAVASECGVESSFLDLLMTCSQDSNSVVVVNTLREQGWIDFELPLYNKVRKGGILREMTPFERELIGGIGVVGTTMENSKADFARVQRLCDDLGVSGFSLGRCQIYVVGDSLSDFKNVTDAANCGIKTQFVCALTKCGTQESRDTLVGSVEEKRAQHNWLYRVHQIGEPIFIQDISELTSPDLKKSNSIVD